MKGFLLTSALALGAMTTVALAESVTPAGGQAGPVSLTSDQMDKVSAGFGKGPPAATGNGVLTAAVSGQGASSNGLDTHATQVAPVDNIGYGTSTTPHQH